MSRRIELELTSRRDDGTWTWRAAGAKKPKGDLDGALLPEGAAVGDVLRADAEFDLDGILITSVLPPKGARPEKPRIEVIGTSRDEGGVTTEWVERKERPRRKGGRDGEGGRPRGREDRGPRGDRPPRGDGPRGEGGRGDGSRGDRPRSDAGGTGKPRGPRPDRPAKPPLPPKPKAKRLRPGRAHRAAVLAELSEEQKPIAEQVLRGGIPAVRQAIDKQNAERTAAGEPEIKPDELVALAEQLSPRLRTAKWRDEAEAALAEADEVDLRDLRSVVVAADAVARDDETRALAQQLRDALAARVEREHGEWLKELADLLADGRVVRALRVSSRPPKAGTPLPPDLAARLVEGARASLTPDTPADRYATVLDALAFSPIRAQVQPEGIPANPSDTLLAAVKKAGSRLPQIATLFGISPAPPTRGGRRGATPPPPPPPPPPPADAAEAPATEVPDAGPPATEDAAPQAPAPSEVVAEPAADPVAEVVAAAADADGDSPAPEATQS